MAKATIDLNAAAREMGLSEERAFEALKREAADVARETTGRASAEPRPDWIEARKQGEALADFMARAFERELASGEMHKGLFSRYANLRTSFYSLQRSNAFPEWMQKLPTESEWHRIQVETGRVKPTRPVAPRTEATRAYARQQTQAHRLRKRSSIPTPDM